MGIPTVHLRLCSSFEQRFAQLYFCPSVGILEQECNLAVGRHASHESCTKRKPKATPGKCDIILPPSPLGELSWVVVGHRIGDTDSHPGGLPWVVYVRADRGRYTYAKVEIFDSL